MALTAEESIGSCGRTAFVVFLQSPGGFDRDLGGSVVGRDPLAMPLKTVPARLNLEYRRADKRLTAGSFVLDVAASNVAVLSAQPTGVTSLHQGTQVLAFERRGKPELWDGPSSDFGPEIATAVRTLLDRSPELRQMIAEPPPAK